MLNNQKLRAFRKAKGLTQEELADILCISQPSYARLENGTSKNGLFYIEKLCEVFTVSPLELLDITIPTNTVENELLKDKLSEKEQIIILLQNRIHNLENTIALFKKLSEK